MSIAFSFIIPIFVATIILTALEPRFGALTRLPIWGEKSCLMTVSSARRLHLARLTMDVEWIFELNKAGVSARIVFKL